MTLEGWWAASCRSKACDLAQPWEAAPPARMGEPPGALRLMVLFMKRFRGLPVDFLMNWFVIASPAAVWVITSETGGRLWS